jgi:hypothetical protein
MIENVLSKLPAGSTKATPKAAFKAIEPKAKVALEQKELSGWATSFLNERMS